MIKRDYYEVLSVQKDADEGEIKKAYRRLAMQYHPDRNQEDPQAEERFKEASEAYEVLSDPHRRQIYNTYGHQGLEGSGFHGFNNVNDIFSSMGDVFEEFFGGLGGFGVHGRRGRARGRQGNDLRHDIVISFAESFKGVEKEVTVHKQAACEVCSGTGQFPGTSRTECRTCGGAGQVTQRQGFFVIQTTCPTCRGEGSKIEKPCEECRGHGKVRKSKKITVKIPAGVEDGMQLVLRGEGEAGDRGAPAGDLYVFIRVEAHDFFKRHGDDLICQIPISFPQAALGAKIKCPTLGDEIEIAVPVGTETGDELRIKGKGFANVHHKGKHGDFAVYFQVKTPKKLSKKQRELLEEFMKSS